MLKGTVECRPFCNAQFNTRCMMIVVNTPAFGIAYSGYLCYKSVYCNAAAPAVLYAPFFSSEKRKLLQRKERRRGGPLRTPPRGEVSPWHPLLQQGGWLLASFLFSTQSFTPAPATLRSPRLSARTAILSSLASPQLLPKLPVGKVATPSQAYYRRRRLNGSNFPSRLSLHPLKPFEGKWNHPHSQANEDGGGAD